MKRKFSRILGVATALMLAVSLMLVMAVPVMAGNPTIALTTGGGIDSLTGTPTESGTEAGAHSIVITDATASTLDGAVCEGVTDGDLAIALTGDETLTLTIGDVEITTDALTASTTLVEAAATVETEINDATTTLDIDVAVTVENPTTAVDDGYLVITVNLAGVLNSITGVVTGLNGGETETGLSTGTLVAGTDADAVDTLTPADGSNGLWQIWASGLTKTIAHSPTAGTASTLAGLKSLVIVADAFIEGITLAASGDLSAGNPVVTVTAGTASLLAITTQPDGSVSGVALTTQPIIEAQDDSGNVDLTYTTDVVAATDDLGAPLTGTTTVTPSAGVATFANLIYTATADGEIFQIDFTSTGITGVTSGDVASDVVATKILLTTAPGSIISGVSMTQPVVTYVDAQDIVDTDIITDVITVTEDGAGSLAGTLTATAALGVATFDGLVYTALADSESVTFTFTDDAASLDLNSLPVNSSALTADVVATKMAFFVQPLAGTNSGLVLGTQPTVQAQNADNTLDTGFVDMVTITTDVGTLSGDVDIVAVLGVAAFTDLVHTATIDNQVTTLTADDVAGGAEGDLTTVNATPFTTLVIATKLVIVTQPAGAVSTAALVLQPVINAVDADGTLDADWIILCAVAKETGTGTVAGGPLDPMVAGVATFTDVTVTETPVVYGSYTLGFSSTGLTDVVSDAFKVYDKVLDLNDDAWTLISTDDYIISSGDDTSAFEGSVSLKYIYTGSSYVPAYVSDIEPVEALYVKTTSDDGCLGLNYSTTASPGASNKSLLAGWNLISSATTTTADIVLSPLQYVQIGEQEGHGLATLVSQGDYNLTSADWFEDTTTWGALIGYTMSPFDGYWVYMNAAKSFGVIPQPALP